MTSNQKRRKGKKFVRNYEDSDGKGFQVLYFGLLWVSIYEGNYKGMKSNYDYIHYFDDCSIMWSDSMVFSMIDV